MILKNYSEVGRDKSQTPVHTSYKSKSMKKLNLELSGYYSMKVTLKHLHP